MHNPIGAITSAVELRGRRADYGIDAPVSGEGVPDRCELKTGDMLAMPFHDNTFDLVVNSLAIHNIDERDLRNHGRRLQAVSEAARVLKPGAATKPSRSKDATVAAFDERQ